MTIRNSLIELRRECKKNSRKSDDMSCIWLEFGACTKVLPRAIITVILIRRFGARVGLVKTYVKISHNSPKLGFWHCTETLFESSSSQLWQSSTSLDMMPTGHPNKSPAMAHAILPKALRASHFPCSVSSGKAWLHAD